MSHRRRSAPTAAFLLTAALTAMAACGGEGGASGASAGPVPLGSLPPTVAPAATTTSSAPTAPVPTPTTTGPAIDSAALTECLSTWSLRSRIALLVWPSVYAADWATAQQVVGDLGVGGVILMKPDSAFAADLATHLGELDSASPNGVLVATDEEGGEIQRLAALGTLPSQEALSAQPTETITATIAAHAAVLRDAGVDVILGPVVDVRPADGSADPLGQGRLFTGDAATVAALGATYVRAWQTAGLLPTLKHYPGHGSASTDTHDGLGLTPPLAELLAWDLVPYRELAGSGAAVMVGHLDVPGLTDGVPASRSAAAITLLRGELGWGDALVMTDALGMGGVGMSLTDAAVASLAAGVDVVLFTDTGQAGAVIDAIEAAVDDGDLDEEQLTASAVRVARELAAHGRPCTAMA